MEALGQTTFNFGADGSNGHVQPTGEYHYHGMPEKFIDKLGKGKQTMTLVVWASDGFPMYARYGYVDASNAQSGVKVFTSSWRKKQAPTVAVPRQPFSLWALFCKTMSMLRARGIWTPGRRRRW